MKRFLHVISTLITILTILLAKTNRVLASGEDGGHLLEMDINGYHVTLSSQNEWAKGENTIVVALTDSMGMPVQNADVEILIAPKSNEHSEAAMESSHGADSQENSMPGMDMGSEQPQDSMPGMDMSAPAEEMPAHDEEILTPMSMAESDEHGTYMVETHLESSGKHEVNVMFHVNGEMLQADFTVEILSVISKTLVLWGFVLVNIALITSAGFMKKQPVPVKGTK